MWSSKSVRQRLLERAGAKASVTNTGIQVNDRRGMTVLARSSWQAIGRDLETIVALCEARELVGARR